MNEEEFKKFIYKVTNQTYNRIVDGINGTDYSSKEFSFLSACGIKYDLEAFECSENFLMEIPQNGDMCFVNLYVYQGIFYVCNLPGFIKKAQKTIKDKNIVTPICVFEMDNLDLCCPISIFLEHYPPEECFIISINPEYTLENAPRIPINEFLKMYNKTSR